MDNVELKSKRRKRKHASEVEEAEGPAFPANDARNAFPSVKDTATSEPHKKKKKKHRHQDKNDSSKEGFPNLDDDGPGKANAVEV